MTMRRKESFFWTSYSDLMTSMFFVMLVMFVLELVLMSKRMQATAHQIEEIKKIQASTHDLDRSMHFIYRPEYKKYVLNIEGRYPRGKYEIGDIIADDKPTLLAQLRDAGLEVANFLERYKIYQYLLVIEGQASRDDYDHNYELSYNRALGLMRYWSDDCGIRFGDNCEILISGSGDGTLDTHSMREKDDESKNQRFLIHIVPKNIFENDETD